MRWSFAPALATAGWVWFAMPTASQAPRDLCAGFAVPVVDLPFVHTDTTCRFSARQDFYAATCAVRGVHHPGPEAIYEIVLNPGNRVAVSLDVAGSAGDLMIALVRVCGDAGSCVASSQDTLGPGLGPEEIPATAYAPGTYFLYVDSNRSGQDPGGCGAYTLRVTGTNPRPAADLAVEVTAPARAVTGSDLTYTATVRNRGPGDAHGVVLSDNLPPGLQLVSAPGCEPSSPGIVACRVGSLAAGESATRTLTVAVPASPPTRELVNVVDLPGFTVEDPNLADNTLATSIPIVFAADLAVRTVEVPPREAGEGCGRDALRRPLLAGCPVAYRVEVENRGPATARRVVLGGEWDMGAAAFAFTLEPATGCAVLSPGPPLRLRCPLGTIAAGETRTITLQGRVGATVADGATLVHRARARSVDPATIEAREGDERDVARSRVRAGADLSIGLAQVPEPAVAGLPLAYALTLENLGPSDAGDLRLTGETPQGLAPASVVGCVSPAGAPLDCALGTLAAGAVFEAVVSFVPAASAAGGTVAYTASISAGTPPTASGRDRRSITAPSVVSAGADLSLALLRRAEDEPATLGVPFVYDLTVANHGVLEVGMAQVVDRLPAGVQPLATTDGCVEDPFGVPLCTLGPVPAAGAVSYAVTVEPAIPSSLVNEAAIVAADVPELRPGDEDARVTTLVGVIDQLDQPMDAAASSSLVLPLAGVDADNPGLASRVELRNETNRLLVLRTEYLEAGSGRNLRAPEVRPLLPREVLAIELETVEHLASSPGSGPVGVSLIATAFDPLTGSELPGPLVLAGEVFAADSRSRTAVGGRLFPGGESPGELCRRWHLPLWAGGPFGLATSFVVFVPEGADSEPVATATIYGLDGVTTGPPITVEGGKRAFVVRAEDLGTATTPGSLEWVFREGLEGHVSALVLGEGFAAALPGFCDQASPEPQAALLLPLFTVAADEGGATTLLALHNGEDEPLAMTFDAVAPDGTKLIDEEPILLPPHGSRVLDLAGRPEIRAAAAPGGTTNGFVLVHPAVEPGSFSPALSGSFLLLDPPTGSGDGGAFVRNQASSINGLCRRWSTRFEIAPPLSTEFLVSIPAPAPGPGPRLHATVFDDQGKFVTVLSLPPTKHTLRLPATELDLGTTAGTVEWTFAPGSAGHVAALRRSGAEAAALTPGQCLGGT